MALRRIAFIAKAGAQAGAPSATDRRRLSAASPSEQCAARSYRRCSSTAQSAGEAPTPGLQCPCYYPTEIRLVRLRTTPAARSLGVGGFCGILGNDLFRFELPSLRRIGLPKLDFDDSGRRRDTGSDGCLVGGKGFGEWLSPADDFGGTVSLEAHEDGSFHQESAVTMRLSAALSPTE